VKTHLLDIDAKFGVSGRAAAVAEAATWGLLTPGTKDP
jgi:DNA-binding CsgD family transcriptional regulator